jgi:hypothetical protein
MNQNARFLAIAIATSPLACGGPAGSASGAPQPLASLAIDGLTMSPAFSPAIHDYAVRCAAGGSTVTVRATTEPGATAQIVQPVAASLAQPSLLHLVENQALVVEVRDAGGQSDEYWVRCLPHDFPAITAKRYTDVGPSYYLLGNSLLGSGEAGYAIVLDENGTPIWYAATTAGAGYTSFVSKNTIAFNAVNGARFGTDPSGHFRVAHLDTGETFSIQTVGSVTDDHEFLPLPNGNFMLLSYPVTGGVDLSSRQIATTNIVDCNIQEVTPQGALVWSWLGSEHFDAVTESTDLEPGTVNGVSIVDPFHCNSLEQMPGGDVLLSARQMDAVVLVSRATGKVVWKLGGVPSNKDGAQILQLQSDPETSFYQQHDARLLANGDITLFDDHTTQTGYARGMEIALDTTSKTAAVTWQYQGPSTSQAMGSFRRYADGSSVVGWGLVGGQGPSTALSEVDASGKRRFDVLFDLGDSSYRALRVGTGDLDRDVLRRTAGTLVP